jgi:SAM-dependent methyltransferase
VADLLDLPAAWAGAFDLVIEVYTAQALPDPPRRAAIDNVARLVAPGGSLVVVAFRWDPTHPSFGDAAAGPPWPLKRADIDAFAAGGLTPVRLDETTDPRSPGSPRWLAVFHRPTPNSP